MTQKILENDERKNKLRKELRGAIVPWIIFGILFLVGIGVLIYSGVRKETRHNNWVATEAVIVNQEVKEKYDTEDKKTKHYYHAVFQYVFDGVEYNVADNTGGSSPIYEVGDTATIYVNPNNPKEFESSSSTQFFYIFGTIVLVISFCALCFTSEPVLSTAFPKADWPEYVGHFLPTAVFLWTVTVVSAIMIKPHSVLSINALIIFIIALIISTFLTIVMIKEIVENAMMNRRS